MNIDEALLLLARPRRGFPSKKLREGELGLEKLCAACNEWWPADDEFFSPDVGGAGGRYNYCKACAAEKIALKRQARRGEARP